ncbi:hypothetical protein PG991_004964 [Apiospora marii]|uniref:Uncharacterized protein n=1 Tax=Apiospora marii TaxID=335849 RepID=A0ABR1S7T3_9PEZI
MFTLQIPDASVNGHTSNTDAVLSAFILAPVLSILVLLAYLVGYAIYALTFHPLAGIPGPKLCAISRLPYWRAYFRGDVVSWMNRLHRRYGRVVRFGPTDLSYTAADAWQDIHGLVKGQPENPKAPEFSVQPVNATLENHSRVRKAFSPAFSEHALREQEPLFREYVDILVRKIGELGKDQKPVEMTKLLNFATFDIMADLCFGSPLGLLEKNEFSPWVASVFESAKMLPVVSMKSYYPKLNALLTRFEPKSVTEQRVMHCKRSANLVDQLLREGSHQEDLWKLVSDDAEKSESKLSLKEMHSNAELLMLAGSETTATLLSGVLYLLLKDPDAIRRLSQEIRDNFQKEEDITFTEIANLPYLNACLKEALRVYPPVPIGSPRVVPQGGKFILGRWVPPETRVAIHHYATYHSESNFTNADAFVPERWLGDPRYADDAQIAHAPFGWGHRDCLGQK